MRELIVATRNRGKLKELEVLLEGLVARILSPWDLDALPEVVEDGVTFADNAIKKAVSASTFGRLPALADDSGLEVDALNGWPGVYSARYAGEGADDEMNNAKLLKDLAGVPLEKRTAAFRCVLALSLPDGSCHTFTGELHGVILDSARGGDGFGYDPLFLIPEFGKTLAELPLALKNSISHRGKALDELKHFLATNF